jgi:hypothetical protein
VNDDIISMWQTVRWILRKWMFDNIEVVRFQVLTAASMKIRAFWDVAPCSLVGVDRRF